MPSIVESGSPAFPCDSSAIVKHLYSSESGQLPLPVRQGMFHLGLSLSHRALRNAANDFEREPPSTGGGCPNGTHEGVRPGSAR